MRRAAKPSVPLDKILQAYGLPAPRLEYAFATDAKRKFRWDACWPTLAGGVALEVDGAVWTQGRHTRGAGFLSDREKDAEGMLRGWIIVHCTPGTITSEKTISQLKRALAAKGVEI